MKFIKRMAGWLHLLIIRIYANVKYPDVWSLKRVALIRGGGGYKTLYYNELKKYCSWIGVNAVFDDIPVFPHGYFGIFVSNEAKIGKNCVIYQHVTIGSNTIKGSKYEGSPTIGDNVLIGSGAKIIGKVKIGNNCRIGANAVVARDVPDNCVVVAETRTIFKDTPLDNRYYSFRDGVRFVYKDGGFVKDNE